MHLSISGDCKGLGQNVATIHQYLLRRVSKVVEISNHGFSGLRIHFQIQIEDRVKRREDSSPLVTNFHTIRLKRMVETHIHSRYGHCYLYVNHICLINSEKYFFQITSYQTYSMSHTFSVFYE